MQFLLKRMTFSIAMLVYQSETPSKNPGGSMGRLYIHLQYIYLVYFYGINVSKYTHGCYGYINLT